MARPFPTVITEFSPTTGPTVAPVWQAISGDTRSLSTNRGRNRELDKFSAGSFAAKLNNRDRDFDPDYSGSPWAGGVKPMRMVRARATWNAVTYDLFTGYADSWTQDYDPPREATATLTATDAFKVLNGIQFGTLWSEVIEQAGPSVWAKLDEGVGTTTGDEVLDSSTNEYTGIVVGSPTFGATPTAQTAPDNLGMRNTGLPDTGVKFVNTPPLNLTQPFAVVASFSIEALTAQILASHLDATGTSGWSLQMSAGGDVSFTVAGGGASLNVAIGSGATIPATHFLIMTWDGTSELRVYYNVGASVALTNATVAVTTSATTLTVGYAPSTFTAVGGHNGVFDELVVLPGAYSGADVDALYYAVLAPYWTSFYNVASQTYAGDTTGERADRYLDFAEIPAALRDIDTGDTVIQGVGTLGGTVLSQLQKLAETENGDLFVQADGILKFRSRSAIVGNTTVVATFGDAAGELPYSSVAYDWADAQIYNEIVATRDNGGSFTARDATSEGDYQRRTLTKTDLLHEKPIGLREFARFLLRRFEDPQRRITRLVIQADRSPTLLYPVVLGLELGDRIRVRRRPQGIGAAVDQEVVVEGIQHQADPSSRTWRTTLSLSPAAPLHYWLLGVAGYSELGQTTWVG